MKLSSLYSNTPEVFPRIDFRSGLNVVFAKITDPADLARDAHNLGKTFLIQVIEFGLLKQIDGEHPFRKHEDFAGFVFFLELESLDGKFVTIRRMVSGRNAVCIEVASDRHADMSEKPVDEWQHAKLSIPKGRDLVNELVDLAAIAPYSYRKGVGYCLRQQRDWTDVFRIARFAAGKDIDWKPYVALVLGFAHDAIQRKYELDHDIELKKADQRKLEARAGADSERYDELRGQIEVRQAAVARYERQLGRFSFGDVERTISKDAVERIETGISRLNDERYTIDYELHEIRHALKTEFELDLEKLKAVFEEVGSVFPSELMRSYEELAEFNRRTAAGRETRLRELRKRLAERRAEIEGELKKLDGEREEALAILREQRTMKKFRGLQLKMREEDAHVLQLKERLLLLDRASLVEHELEELQGELSKQVARITADVRKSNPTYKTIRGKFSEMVEGILNLYAVLSVTLNRNNNLEFNVKTHAKDERDRETEEGEGTSYKKLLCACFDLAVLATYAQQPFYRFLYHDGVLEGLDNRKKVGLLELVRGVCADQGLQYVLTVIDTDLPRDDHDGKLLFSEKEIVRELDDTGDDGRLFRMRAF